MKIKEDGSGLRIPLLQVNLPGQQEYGMTSRWLVAINHNINLTTSPVC